MAATLMRIKSRCSCAPSLSAEDATRHALTARDSSSDSWSIAGIERLALSPAAAGGAARKTAPRAGPRTRKGSPIPPCARRESSTCTYLSCAEGAQIPSVARVAARGDQAREPDGLHSPSGCRRAMLPSHSPICSADPGCDSSEIVHLSRHARVDAPAAGRRAAGRAAGEDSGLESSYHSAMPRTRVRR